MSQEHWRSVLGPASELPRINEAARFEAGGRAIAVFNVAGEFYAVDDTCTHRPASLSLEGRVEGTTVICGWHRSMFDLLTGTNVGPPACANLRAYDLEISDVVVASERVSAIAT